MKKNRKDKKLIKINQVLLTKIEKTFNAFLNRLWIPLAFYMIILLGYLQHRFEYKSSLIQDFAENMGKALDSIYHVGINWEFFLTILFIGTIYFWIDETISIWKEKGKKKR